MKRITVISLMVLFVSTFIISLPASADDEFGNLGYRLYKKNCWGCHGLHGQGYPPVGPALVNNKFMKENSNKDIGAFIRNGAKDESKERKQYIYEKDGYMNMPIFTKHTISNDELDQLVSYLKSAFQTQN
ncbi:MAG: c-type cytochrome [Candidatus Anammoxibacter sp.]